MQPEVIEIGEVEDIMVGQEDEGRANVRKMSKDFVLCQSLLFSQLGGPEIFSFFAI